MAHFARLGKGNVVEQIIVVHNNEAPTEEAGIQFIKTLYPNDNSVWKQTSYNTRLGVHLLDGTPFRKNYASEGGYYDEERDAFIRPQPFRSWVFNETTCDWDAPITYPGGDDGDGLVYDWSEDQRKWLLRDSI